MSAVIDHMRKHADRFDGAGAMVWAVEWLRFRASDCTDAELRATVVELLAALDTLAAERAEATT